MGYEISRTPHALLQHPKARLKVKFEQIVAFHMLRCPDFFFVQIGAHDGLSNDPIHEFVVRFGWRGILVEPQKTIFMTLKKNYQGQAQLIFENVAISTSVGTQQLYKFRDTVDASDWKTQQASLRQGQLLRLKKVIPNVEDLIEQETVESIDLDTLLQKYNVSKLDLLQVDTEGFDAEIIQMIDFTAICPAIIHYEHKHLSNSQQEVCLTHLINNGYYVSIDSYFNTVAYHKSYC